MASAKFKLLAEGKLDMPQTQVKLAGLPRWRCKFNTLESFSLPPPQCLPMEIPEACSIWFKCPKCKLSFETKDKALRNGPESKQGPWSKLYCIHCGIQSCTGAWGCTCCIKWHHCASHSAPHLEGVKNVRRTSDQVAAANFQETVGLSAVLVPSVRPLVTRNLQGTVPSSKRASSVYSVQHVSTGSLEPGSVLGFRFPHPARKP